MSAKDDSLQRLKDAMRSDLGLHRLLSQLQSVYRRRRDLLSREEVVGLVKKVACRAIDGELTRSQIETLLEGATI